MSEEQPLHVLVGPLPPETVEEDVLDSFLELGYDLKVRLVRDGDSDNVLAQLTFQGMTRTAAENLATQINGFPYRGRTLRAYVPRFWK